MTPKEKRARDRIEKKRAQKKRALSRYYNLNSILGHQVPIMVIIGGRKTGKSYSFSDFICRHAQDKNYWMRISETSTKALLANNCKGLVDPDLQRRYQLDLKTVGGMYVYNHGKEFCTVCPLSAFGKLKGVGFYDKDYDGWYNVVLDEFQLEQGERRTSFDILYNFIGMCENTLRTTKKKVRLFLAGNTLEESCTILKALNFIPQSFGRFCIHRFNKYTKKREKYAVIDNLEPTEEYLADRYGSIADLLGGDRMSNYTNELIRDVKLISGERKFKPIGLIKFTKDREDWYTIWNSSLIARYNGEKLKEARDFAMRPGIQTIYQPERRQTIIDLYDARALKFDSLITQSYFQDAMLNIRGKK